MNNKPLFAGVSLLIVVLLVIAGVFLSGNNLGILKQWLPGKSTEQAQAVPLSGFLLLSLGAPSTATSSPQIFPAMLDAAANKAYVLPVTELNGKPGIAIEHAFSPDSNQAVFLGATSNPALSIYTAALDPTDQYDQVVAKLRSATEAAKPTSEDYFRQYPAITDNGAILYGSISKAQLDASGSDIASIPANEWGIYYLPTASSTPSLAAYGLRPKWINATQFAYLASDGLYVFDFDTASSTRVWASKNELTVRDSLSLSSDGTRAVVSLPEEGQVQVLTIPNWYSGIIQDTTVIPATAGDAVISPDNANVAMVTVSQTSDGSKPEPTIRYFSLNTHNFVDQKSPISSDTTAVYLTGWQN